MAKLKNVVDVIPFLVQTRVRLCTNVDCRFNKDGSCGLKEITINWDGCNSYEMGR